MKLTLTSDLFKIEPAPIIGNIISFIKTEMTAMRRTGIVVPLSGGLDSSTVAALCVKAVGSEKVTALLLPEKQGNPEAEVFTKILCSHLKINAKTIDISRGLKALGTYDFVLAKIPGRKVRGAVVRRILANKESAFLTYQRGKADSLHCKGGAVSYIKHRVRMVVVYKYAEENRLLVAGAAHKSEDMVGLFVKFGVDDCADIMPLKYLFRSHILQLARFLKVPDEIISRTPNPGIIAGVDDKYRGMLGLEPAVLDLILYGYEKELTAQEICRQLDIPLSKVEEILELIDLTAHQRNPSKAPVLV